MPRRGSSGSRPTYWHPRSASDRDELREIERCLESDVEPDVAQPLPPVDPFGEWWDGLPNAKRFEFRRVRSRRGRWSNRAFDCRGTSDTDLTTSRCSPVDTFI